MSKFKHKVLTRLQRARRRTKIANNIKQAYALGMARKQIIEEQCEKYRLSPGTVRNIMRQISLPSPLGRLHTKTYLVIADLIHTPQSITDIGKKFSVSRERIRQIYAQCRLANIPVQIRKRGCTLSPPSHEFEPKSSSSTSMGEESSPLSPSTESDSK
jgi:hypothetical protein